MKPTAEDEDVITCSVCPRVIWFRDSYSPGDEALCAECDTEVTGRQHPPSLAVTKRGFDFEEAKAKRLRKAAKAR